MDPFLPTPGAEGQVHSQGSHCSPVGAGGEARAEGEGARAPRARRGGCGMYMSPRGVDRRAWTTEWRLGGDDAWRRSLDVGSYETLNGRESLRGSAGEVENKRIPAALAGLPWRTGSPWWLKQTLVGGPHRMRDTALR